ncbi:MAG: class I SAM-dependent methyltransferase [Candidatus Omnitrophota bacterium]
MKRKFIDKEVIESIGEVLVYDKMLKTYHFWMCRPQINTVLRIAKKIQSQKQAEGGVSILDIGCGTARIPITVAKKLIDCNVTAVDLSQNMLEVAKNDTKEAGISDRIDFKLSDGSKLDFADNSFDIVMCSNMLHHQKEPVKLLKEMKRMVKGNGAVFVFDLLRPFSKWIIEFYVAVVGIPYNKAQKQSYRESLYSSFSLKEIKDALQSAGLKGAMISAHFPHFLKLLWTHN